MIANRSNYNMLGPLPTLSASENLESAAKFVHRITEIGARMLAKNNLIPEEETLPALSSKPCLHALMVTMGKHGFVIVRRTAKEKWNDPLLLRAQSSEDLSDGVVGLHFSSPSVDAGKIKSVSGAGDCLASGFLMGVAVGLRVTSCAALASAAAAMSLQSIATVPSTIESIQHLHPQEPAAIYVLE